jgi:hypothetical protein
MEDPSKNEFIHFYLTSGVPTQGFPYVGIIVLLVYASTSILLTFWEVTSPINGTAKPLPTHQWQC